MIQSGDGSSTLFNEDLNETYHSTHGAITESRHVFIKHGMNVKNEPAVLHVLEIGMGTGLNVLLSLQYSRDKNQEVHYHTLEPYPLTPGLINGLNYEEQLNDPSMKGNFLRIHHAPWGEPVSLAQNFTLYKYQQRLEIFETLEKFDLIYFDAFGPQKQPDIWDVNNFHKIALFMNSGACIVSYCASGQFKRNLKSAGFILESLPGPPGKFEMTRATKP